MSKELWIEKFDEILQELEDEGGYTEAEMEEIAGERATNAVSDHYADLADAAMDRAKYGDMA